MREEVDPRAGVLRAAGREWPFELDCRAGTASVELAGGRLVVRPLSWREKRNLARFAGAGEELLERQLLRLCVERGGGAERDPAAAAEPPPEALLALARWINSPAEPALPLAGGLLTRVGFEVCRLLGCGPSGLDELPAHEVEALWQEVRKAAEEKAQELGSRGESTVEVRGGRAEEGMTQIIVLPDTGASLQQSDRMGLREEEEKDPGREKIPALSSGSVPAASPRRSSVGEIPLEPAASLEANAQVVPERAAISPGGDREIARSSVRGSRASRGLFRVSLPEAPVAVRRRSAITGADRAAGPFSASEEAAPSTVQPAPSGVPTASFGHAGPPLPDLLLAATALAVSHPVRGPLSPASPDLLLEEPPLLRAARAPGGVAERGVWPEPEPSPPAALSSEEWFDELADRLAEAAADLGIDLEG